MQRAKRSKRKETRERISLAVRTITVRNGLRAITMEAIAQEAGVAKGTVGMVKMDGILRELINYMFVPLLSRYEAQGSTISLQKDLEIRSLVENEPGLACLVMQVSALAMCPLSGFLDYFSTQRANVENELQGFLVRDGCRTELGKDFDATYFVQRYLEIACGMALNQLATVKHGAESSRSPTAR